MVTQNTINSPLPIPVSHGGTGAATLLQHAVLLGNTTSPIQTTNVGSNGTLLIGASTANPSFAAPTSTASSITYTTGTNTLNLDVTNYTAQTSGTPSLLFGGAGVGITTSQNFFQYLRIGNIIYLKMIIALSSKGSSTGTATITGVPIAAHADTETFIMTGTNTPCTSLTNLNVFATLNNSSTLNIYTQTANAGITVLTDANFNNTTTLMLSGFYIA